MDFILKSPIINSSNFSLRFLKIFFVPIHLICEERHFLLFLPNFHTFPFLFPVVLYWLQSSVQYGIEVVRWDSPALLPVLKRKHLALPLSAMLGVDFFVCESVCRYPFIY